MKAVRVLSFEQASVVAVAGTESQLIFGRDPVLLSPCPAHESHGHLLPR